MEPTKKTMRAFESWTEGDIQTSFGLRKQKKLAALNDWLSLENITIERNLPVLQRLQTLLQDNTNIWNEDELKMNFIGPFLLEVNYFETAYRNFSQRKFTATINDIFIGGVVDYVVSCGYQKPEHPFFCLHEYKRPRRNGTYNDPVGQLLAEMITVQHLNQQKGREHPIYGIYVEGKFWNFIVLNGNEYAESESYNANTNQLYEIFALLKKLKTIISDLITNYKL